MMESPIYTPLASIRGRIRLLEIHPAKANTTLISCTLREVGFDESPTYEALSYTWGLPDPKRIILLNDQTFDTFENLEAALHHLRKPKVTRTFWFDALCINQSDEEEKGQQVAQMGEIYRKASQVVIWLGEPRGGSRAAMVSFGTKHINPMNNIRMQV
jgi:hypothetical protein